MAVSSQQQMLLYTLVLWLIELLDQLVNELSTSQPASQQAERSNIQARYVKREPESPNVCLWYVHRMQYGNQHGNQQANETT